MYLGLVLLVETATGLVFCAKKQSHASETFVYFQLFQIFCETFDQQS